MPAQASGEVDPVARSEDAVVDAGGDQDREPFSAGCTAGEVGGVARGDGVDGEGGRDGSDVGGGVRESVDDPGTAGDGGDVEPEVADPCDVATPGPQAGAIVAGSGAGGQESGCGVGGHAGVLEREVGEELSAASPDRRAERGVVEVRVGE